jgi:hypothetical protein
MAVHGESQTFPGRLRWAVLGAFAFAAAQIPLLVGTRTLPGGPSTPGWFLNSGQNALIVGGVMALVAAVVSLRALASFQDVLFYATGAVSAMIGTLFAIGPGAIFPIVVVFGVCILGLAVAVGGTLGTGVRAWRTRAG